MSSWYQGFGSEANVESVFEARNCADLQIIRTQLIQFCGDGA